MDPKVTAMFSSLRNLLMVAIGILATLGLTASPEYKWTMIAAGAVGVVGPAIWDFWATIKSLLTAQAVGAAAGITMTVQGKALAEDGKVISKFSAAADATPPKAVTVASATEIVKNFGPETTPEQG